MLKAVIVDDEVAALRTLELLLQAYCPNVTVVGKGESVREGLALVKKHNPDIVFLDIEMPEANGFELLEQLPDLNFEVIFITAYNQYAIKAFRYSAIDYILKPIDIDELVRAVDKVNELRKSKVNPRERYAALFQNIEEMLPRKLVIPTLGGHTYIDLNNVILMKSESDKLTFSLANSTAIETPRGTLDVENTMIQKGFYALKCGVYINLNRVEKVDKRGTGKVYLTGNYTVSLENDDKDLFMENLVKHSSKNK
jgi:two-component system LytT family response regulator